MKELLIGTTNPAKVDQIRAALRPLGIRVQGLPADLLLPDVEEDGTTAQENARKKAMVYAKALAMPVLSMDNALYLDGLPADQQPGLHVRRFPGSTGRPTDADMLSYYSKLISELADPPTGYWEYAICTADPSGHLYETTIRSTRHFVSTPCPQQVVGYPLESIQIEPATGTYIAAMTEEEKEHFWQKTIGEPLCAYVQSIPI